MRSTMAVVTTGSPQVVAEFLEVDVGGDEGGALAVPAVYDLEEEGGVSRVLLLQPVKTQFIDEENVGCGILFEPSMKAVVGLAGKKVREHIGRGGVPASVELFAANE